MRSRGSGNRSVVSPMGLVNGKEGPNLGVATHRNRLTGVEQQQSEQLRTRQDPPCQVS